MLAAVLATQLACMAEIKEQCPLVTEARPPPALPHDLAQIDGLLYHRALQMMHDVHQLHGSATTSFHIWFAYETLPLLCGRMQQARKLAMAGQVAAAGRKYQALLVISQLMEMAIAVHAVVEYADAVKEPSLILVQTSETYANQVKPILEAALSEEPRRIEKALREQPEVFSKWMQYLARWTTHIRADAQRMEVAKLVWDITIGAMAAYETAGELAEMVAASRPPMPPLAAFGIVGGDAAALGMSRGAYLELAEAVRKLLASGALDAGVVAALSVTLGAGSGAMAPPMVSSAVQMSAGGPKSVPSSTEAPAGGGDARSAQRFSTAPERTALLKRVIKPGGELNASKTVAQQLSGSRSYIPTQAILETIGSGTRIADPKGVAGHFMYRSAASVNGSQGVLEVLVDEVSGQIRHVLFVSGAAP